MYKVEYLITVDQNKQFCKSKSTFNSLIQTIEGVSISNSQLSIGTLHVRYEVDIGKIDRDKLHYFHIKLSIDENQNLQDFEAFLKSFRSVLNIANGRPAQVLWDGVSSDYAQKAYPILHELENTMRKLITKFMLINVGLGWTKETMPKEVSDSVRNLSKSVLDHNFLFEVDFIQLSKYLFREYSPITHPMLLSSIEKISNVSELDIDELRKAIPKSNWDRYFSSIVKCKSEYLSSRWEELYEKRNMVAHNRPISKNDFERISTLTGEVLPKLQQAIEDLDRVAISEVEREIVSDSAGFEQIDFFKAWTDLNISMYMVADNLTLSADLRIALAVHMQDIEYLANILRMHQVFSDAQRAEVLSLDNLRAHSLRQPNSIVDFEALNAKVQNVARLILFLRPYIGKIESNETHTSR